MKQKIMLSEDNAISKEDIEETVLLSSADSTEKKDEVSESSVATGILSLLNSLIIDEWEAIDGYNSTIESLSTLTGIACKNALPYSLDHNLGSKIIYCP